MPLVRINVQRCIQDSQELGSTDKHMVSRVFFSIEVDGVSEGDDYCEIKQTVGSTYSPETLEVSRPYKYRGPYDHRAFSDEIARYFSTLVNSSGAVISVGNPQPIRMMHNIFVSSYHFQFDAEGSGASW